MNTLVYVTPRQRRSQPDAGRKPLRHHVRRTTVPCALQEQSACCLPLEIMIGLPRYFLWLFKEILMSNYATAKVILSDRADPEIFETPASQTSEAGIATYANSITLTPGTVTVDIGKGHFLVHALTKNFGDDVRSQVMDAKVAGLETKEANQ